MLFLLNTLCRWFEGEKCLSMRFRKVLPTQLFNIQQKQRKSQLFMHGKHQVNYLQSQP